MILIVGVICSAISSNLYALKVQSPRLCEKSTSDGITTETCCSLETDSSTEETTEYCTECKTTSKGEDLGCTHTQTNVGFTIDNGVLGIKPIGPKLQTDKMNDGKKFPKFSENFDSNLLTKGGQSTNEDNKITTNQENSKTPPPCPKEGPIPPNCTMKPVIK